VLPGIAQDGRDHLGDVAGSDWRGGPVPNGSANVPFSRIDRAAREVNNGLSRNFVGRTCTTGRPDQSSTCSASQCSRCWWDSAVFVVAALGECGLARGELGPAAADAAAGAGGSESVVGVGHDQFPL
jgi:hypothetical protein